MTRLPKWDHFQDWYRDTLDDVLENEHFRRRQGFWSSAAAVGDPDWLEQTADHIGMKRFDAIAVSDGDGFGLKSFFLRARSE